MLPLRATPAPDRPSRGGRVFVFWLISVLIIIAIEWIKPPLRRLNVSTAIFTLVEFLAWLIVIALLLYGFAVFVRWLMRALFWRVGRRLFLSYMLIGLLPFFLFARGQPYESFFFLKIGHGFLLNRPRLSPKSATAFS